MNMVPVNIVRPATLSDAASLSALAIQVWLHTYAKFGVSNEFADYVLDEYSIARMGDHLKSRSKKIWLCEANGFIRGFLVLTSQSPCPGLPALTTEISTLYVQEHCLRQSIGTALLSMCERYCKENAIDGLWLSVNRENNGARAFYRRKQFMDSGRCDFVLADKRYENIIVTKSFA